MFIYENVAHKIQYLISCNLEYNWPLSPNLLSFLFNVFNLGGGTVQQVTDFKDF